MWCDKKSQKRSQEHLYIESVVLNFVLVRADFVSLSVMYFSLKPSFGTILSVCMIHMYCERNNVLQIPQNLPMHVR